MTAKKCPRCGEDDQAQFFPSKLRQVGVSTLCKACHLAWSREYRGTPEGRAISNAASARWLAKSPENRQRCIERSRRFRERRREQKRVTEEQR